MIWIRRTLLSAPFAVALLLTVLVAFAHRLHLRVQRIAGYGFVFATPWAWLIERLWMPSFHTRWIESMLGYVEVLWIPAVLYSACLWVILRVLGILANGSRA